MQKATFIESEMVSDAFFYGLRVTSKEQLETCGVTKCERFSKIVCTFRFFLLPAIKQLFLLIVEFFGNPIQIFLNECN